MKKTIKWLGIILGSFVVLIILALIIVPLFIDIQKFKPRIEQEVTKATGRAFTIGGDLKLSLFPWAGLAFSDLHMGNPEGFSEKDFLSIESFDVKVKFLPLLSKDIRVKRFVIEGPKIILEKTKEGRVNWQGFGGKESADASTVQEETEQDESQDMFGDLPIKDLTVGEFAVWRGELLYIDRTSDIQKEIKDLNIELKDVSLDQPIIMAISANVEGKNLSVEGEAGPVGKEPGKGTMPVNLAVKAMDLLSVKLEGSITDIASRPQFDLNLSVDNFSPRDLMKALIPDLELKTKDPEALNSLSVKIKIKGTTEDIEVSDGTIELDQSRMTFSAAAKDFEKPDLAFKMDLDKLDADRYLPLVDETLEEPDEETDTQTKIDYEPLRKMVLDSAINIGELTIKGTQVKDIQVRIKGKDGVFDIDRLSLNAYEGSLSTTAVMNVSGDIPAIQADMDIKGIQLRNLQNGLLPDLVLNTKDPEALKTLSVKSKVKGTTENIDVSDGTIELDQSRMTFSAGAKDFSKPDITFKMHLDQIDADRYMPPLVEEKEVKTAQSSAGPEKQEKTDYGPLRKLVLDSSIDIGQLTIKGTQVKDIQVRVKGKNGVFDIDHLSLNAYGGSLSTAAIMNVSGEIPALQADMEIKGLQLRKAINGLLPDLVLNTKDPETLKTLSLKIKMIGTTEDISVSDGTIELDQSRMTFSASAKDFKKPDLAFKINLDKLDADRYLPPVDEAEEKSKEEIKTQTKIDYEPLRKIVLDGAINAGELTIKGVQIMDIKARVKGQKGVFNVNPFSFNAYEGSITSTAAMDVSGESPKTKAKMDVKNLQVRKLIYDFMKKDILEGTTKASMDLSMSGDNAEQIKKTLNGKGELKFSNGAIVGIDLTGMVNNLKAAFGNAHAAKNTERTDFSEFIVPFDIKDGVVTTQNTTLVSPVLRVKAEGDADLPKDSLDFRIEPTFVKTLKGQGDTEERSGVTVPVLVTGSITEPKFGPDLKGMAKKTIEKEIEKGVEKLLKDKIGQDEKKDATKDAVKDLLKGILGK